MSSLNLLTEGEKIPEFVTLQMAAGIIGRRTSFLHDIHLAAGVPSKIDANGCRMYRWSELRKRLERNNIMPPDDDHPFMEYTFTKAAVLLGTSERRIYHWINMGRLRVSKRKSDGASCVLRKDIEWFRRNYDRQVLISRMAKPLRTTDTRTILDLKKDTFYDYRKHFVPIPRAKRVARRYDQATLMAFTKSSETQRRRFRCNPMPEYMNREIARIYLGYSESKMSHCLDAHQIKSKPVELPDGRITNMYIKSELDEHLLKTEMVSAYCEGLPYYNRKAIEHKFGKTARWIDEYVANDCRRIGLRGEVIPARKDAKINYLVQGWHRGDVEEAVRTCGDEHITLYERAADREREKERREHEALVLKRTKQRLKAREERVALRERELAKKKAEAKAAAKPKPKPQPVSEPAQLFHSPIDQIEAAIDAGFAARNAEFEQKKREAKRKANAKREARNAIRDSLNLVTSYPDSGFNMWNRLAYSESREIFTILFSRNGSQTRGGSMRYMAYPHEGDEYIINVTDRRAVTRRQSADTSIPRLIARGIEAIKAKQLKYMPAWVVLAPATSYVPDPRFLDILRTVPDEYGAVAPYGYKYLMPDGSHDTCTATCGMYSMYHADSPGTEFVVGATVGGVNEVAVLDGPFVAVRGECMDILSDMDFFGGLGESRSMIGPIVSAICRRRAVKMASVPVNSVSCADYVLPVHSLEWNQIMDKIATYASTRV